MSATSRFLDAHPWALGMSFEEAMADPRYVEDCGSGVAPLMVQADLEHPATHRDTGGETELQTVPRGELRASTAQPAPDVLDSQLRAGCEVADDQEAYPGWHLDEGADYWRYVG